MTKFLLATTYAFLLLFSNPAQAMTGNSVEIVENDVQNISLSLSGSVLTIKGANGETMQIYNVAGMKVMNVKIEGDEKRFELNLPKGCYIVKIGKFVRKISVR